MDRAATYPTDVATLHLMLDEQRALIESLKANLHRLLKWRFGPKSEVIDVDQFALFTDESVVIEVPKPNGSDTEQGSMPILVAPTKIERRRAVRVLSKRVAEAH